MYFPLEMAVPAKAILSLPALQFVKPQDLSGITTQMQNAAFSERKGQPHCDWGTKALHNHHVQNLFKQFLSCKALHCITQNKLFENFVCCVIIAGSTICFHFL